MAKYSPKHSNKALFNLALVAFMAVAAVIGLTIVTSENSPLSFSRAQRIGPLDINPCSGSWNKTDCFNVKNVTAVDVNLKYHLDCWDETKCTDEQKTIVLKAGTTTKLGLGQPCSKYQVDLNWTGKEGWDWGGIVEMPADCGVVTPPASCNFVDLKVTT